MKRIEFKLPQNLWQLSDKEIAVIQALAFYHPDGMTKEADKICLRIRDKLLFDNAIKKFKVWRN